MGGGKHPLAFLGKKSWHTKNIKNVEKVWIAEQKDEAEKKAMADLEKQIREEREINVLWQMQVDAGLKKKGTEKLDWMYEGPASVSDGAAASAESDEYLLGKAYEPKVTGELKEKLSANADQPPPAQFAYKPPSANEMFTRMHEDPMMKIRQHELKAREIVAKNPLKMKRVKEQIEAQLRAEMEEKRKKKDARKDRKKEKKNAKTERKKSERESKKRHRRRDTSSSSRGDCADDRGGRGGDGRRGRGSGGSGEGHHERQRDVTTRDHRDDECERDGWRDERPEERRKDPQYGLQGSKQNVYSRDELGPSVNLHRAQEAGDLAVAVPYRPDKKRARFEREHMTDGEKARRIREMQSNASEHEQRRAERVSRGRTAVANDADASQRRVEGEGPGFIRDMERSVYVSGNLEMEDRVKTGRQNQQRSGDLADLFMKR